MADGLKALLINKAPGSTYIKAANISSKSNWDLLNEGQNPLVIITPGAAPRDESEGALTDYYAMDWHMDVHCISRYIGPMPNVHDLLINVADAVQQTVDQWPGLNGVAGVEKAVHMGWIAPNELFPLSGGGPHAIEMIVPVVVTAGVTYTAQED